ncbi:MAG TPA: hypothetical protein VGB63_13680 [Pedobacter sp.]|jgi:hypothetical protein
MTFPTLPTDSLYKFIFIAGLTLFTVSTYLLGEQKLHYDRRLDDLNIRYYKNAEDISTDSLLYPIFSANAIRDRISLDSILAHRKIINAHSRENTALLIETKAVVREFKWYFSIYLAAVVVGGILAIFSGIQWYYKLQTFQDSIIAMEFELKRLELEEKKSPARIL